ncbi:hypothetical protein BDV96DRAFT_393070 [Lophiotrema nucula]|uniref:Uncharacterized protein n=1 Tax=Lophiotrema nucula TaxID=690887 RepID=A0A6A5YD44_9PLEO|nr:hypothetical protein BDV96DRAFT_393070 [Lophiotrema nucula]
MSQKQIILLFASFSYPSARARVISGPLLPIISTRLNTSFSKSPSTRQYTNAYASRNPRYRIQSCACSIVWLSTISRGSTIPQLKKLLKHSMTSIYWQTTQLAISLVRFKVSLMLGADTGTSVNALEALHPSFSSPKTKGIAFGSATLVSLAKPSRKRFARCNRLAFRLKPSPGITWRSRNFSREWAQFTLLASKRRKQQLFLSSSITPIPKANDPSQPPLHLQRKGKEPAMEGRSET